jgi:hypothetical protein
VVLTAGVIASATLSPVRLASAQSFTTEADVTAGATTQDVKAGATRVRAFGDVRGWQYYGDASWATRSGPQSDSFGAAYPYQPRPRLLELNVEKTEISDKRLLGVRLGRYRTPFGIYSGSDQGYMGFLRAPLMRTSYYWGLSNNYLETGASVIGGTTWLSAEASASVATDEDKLSRPGGMNAVVRVQGAAGPWIGGVSYIRTRPSPAWGFATGRAEFSGVDLRWMKSGVQLRGEWIEGRPYAGSRTRGGYADVIVHKVGMGPVTAVARVERLDYFAGRFSQFPRRYTLGAKIRLIRGLTAQINQVEESHPVPAYSRGASTDFALTYTVRAGSWLGHEGR